MPSPTQRYLGNDPLASRSTASGLYGCRAELDGEALNCSPWRVIIVENLINVGRFVVCIVLALRPEHNLRALAQLGGMARHDARYLSELGLIQQETRSILLLDPRLRCHPWSPNHS